MDASNKAVHISVNESVSEVNEGLLFESASENMQFGDRLAEHPLLITYVLACKEDYRMIRVSSTIARLGYSPESWFDHSNFRLTLVHEEDSERISRALQHSVHTGDKFNCCYRLYDSSGQVNWFHDMASVTFDDRGMPLLLKGVMLDITDKKSLETELYEHRYYIERKVDS
jgi:PAS domain-containing protein